MDIWNKIVYNIARFDLSPIKVIHPVFLWVKVGKFYIMGFYTGSVLLNVAKTKDKEKYSKEHALENLDKAETIQENCISS